MLTLHIQEKRHDCLFSLERSSSYLLKYIRSKLSEHAKLLKKLDGELPVVLETLGAHSDLGPQLMAEIYGMAGIRA